MRIGVESSPRDSLDSHHRIYHRIFRRVACPPGLFVLFFSALATLNAQGAEYPERAIRVVVPSSPGTVVDSVARIVAPRMSEKLGQPLVIENQDGAGGVLGATRLANSPKDGYTIGIAASGIVITPNFQKTTYDVLRDFDPIMMIGGGNAVLAVSQESPIKSLQDLLQVARAKAGSNSSLMYGSPGVGTPMYLASAMLFSTADIKVTHVPYRSFSQYLVDLISNRVDAGFVPEEIGVPQIQSGKLRAIAVSTAMRSKALPDVQTIAEAGYPAYSYDSWFVIFTPAGLPDGVKRSITEAARFALENTEVKEALEKKGLTPLPADPEQSRRTFASDYEKYRAIAQMPGIKSE